ncbi:uncharacterized protein (TIGR02231 family) [Neolewinella xylanilytica]|uniref:Uncharacterized protein (TIGR02231 family) n=1 Tax=Neolewinella xylanilytica TaxID=1514080 RepID=A0A2S6I0P6_9BACT|nr:DUF4139 domain-containing protein [Neolewinella xylanilytica]PPK84347.1 uncharacterized protein (TIGR02231 family) [Neolewinella xylanilytica]
MHPTLSLLLCSFFALSFSVLGQADVRLASTIDEVTVYREGAQVSRSAPLNLAPGRQTIVLTGITESLVEKSIQVAVANESLLILGVRHRLHFADAPALAHEALPLTAERETLASRERALRTRIGIGEEEEAILQANRKLSGDNTGVGAAELEAGVRYHRERITTIRMERLELMDSLRLVADRQKLLAQRLSELTLDSVPSATSEIVVEVDARSGITDSIRFTYLVAEAGWEPAYDLRLTELDRTLQLGYRARVHQRTGEDWREVRLRLSTSDPGRTAQIPELKTWRLATNLHPPVYHAPDPGFTVTQARRIHGVVSDRYGSALVGATVIVAGTDLGTVTDIDGRFTLQLPSGADLLRVTYLGYTDRMVPVTDSYLTITLDEAQNSLEEVVVAGYGGRRNGLSEPASGTSNLPDKPVPPQLPITVERQATNLQFQIDLPYTIVSGEAARLVSIQDFDVPATYRHFAVPKVDERVFLSAIVRDWEQYDLLSGEVQLFVAGTYLGTSQLDATQTADSLVFSLGPDPAVVIHRTAAERYSREVGLLGGKRVVWRGWEVAVRNTKRMPVDLTIIDQVPVSAEGTIDVETELPAGANYDPQTGQVEWRTVLSSGSEWQTEFGYRVRYSGSGSVYLE